MLVAHKSDPLSLEAVVDGKEDGHIQGKPDEADQGKLAQLLARVAVLAFGERPAPVEKEVLHYGRGKADRIGLPLLKARKLNQNIEDGEICHRTGRADSGKFDEALGFFAFAPGERDGAGQTFSHGISC